MVLTTSIPKWRTSLVLHISKHLIVRFEVSFERSRKRKKRRASLELGKLEPRLLFRSSGLTPRYDDMPNVASFSQADRRSALWPTHLEARKSRALTCQVSQRVPLKRVYSCSGTPPTSAKVRSVHQESSKASKPCFLKRENLC